MTKSKKQKNEWPNWFAIPSHPVEEEILRKILEENERVSTAFVTSQMMQINYGVFARNYKELRNIQDNYNTPLNFREVALNTPKGENITADAILEYTRLLHNFLASSKMLVDTTRRWVRQVFGKTEFIKQYQNKIDKHFANNVQAQFLEDLRNFTLHRKLPISKPELRMTQVSEKSMRSSMSLVLDKTQLLEWKEWSELARFQIELFQDSNIDIEAVTNQYFENVTSFSKWLFWQIREIFDPEVEYYNSVLEKLRKGSWK